MAKKSKRKPATTKKSKRRSVKKTARAAASARAAVPPSGPVTLAEARVLAKAKQPKLALQKAAAVKAASPANVGAEREELEQERDQEFARRVREYKATMTIMKQRGARRPKPKGGGAAVAAAPQDGSFQPLQIFAEGDSWFDYPVPFFGGGVIDRLEDRVGVPILNLAKAGDEVRYMLGVKERTLLIEHLTDGSPAGGPWDVLLFSGGGNDIVDNPMALWVKDWDPAVPPASLIHQARFTAALDLVRAGFEDLIALRDQLSPNTHLVFHGYDFAIPDGRGICGFGPWLKPTFDLRKFPNRAAMSAVVQAMLRQFATVLTALATAPKVTFINGQGTLPAQPASWHNELHPTSDGFDKFADIFHAKLKVLFPARVA
jgi:hypothetical protein